MTEILTQKHFVEATSPLLNNWSGVVKKSTQMALSLYIMSIDHQYLPLKFKNFVLKANMTEIPTQKRFVEATSPSLKNFIQIGEF